MGNTGLGFGFDIGTVVVPIDLADGTNTGSRIHMMNYGAVTFVCYLNNGTSGEAPTFDVQEATANTGGTIDDLDVIDEYWFKMDTALDGNETWTRATQSAASEVTNAVWDDANEVIVAFTVRAEQLTDGYEWVTVVIGDTGTLHLGCVLAIMHDLKVMRAPQNLVQPNA